MKCYWLTISAVCLSGCMASNGLQYDSVAQTNVYRIGRVNKGMSEKEVLQIMKRPYSYETFDFGEDIYDVWFYVTRPTGLDQTRMVPMNLTPLTFRNGVLVGTGYDYYYFLTKEEAKREAAANPPEAAVKKKENEVEDKEFEKALKTPKVTPEAAPSPQPPAKTPAPQATPPPKAPTPARSSLVPFGTINRPIHTWGSKLSSRFSSIQMGMSKAQVEKVLGEPESEQSFAVESDLYDVWFYEKAPSRRNRQRTTPLTFKNGILVGTTYEYYERVKKRANPLDEERVGGYDKSGEDLQQRESESDFDFW